MKLHEIAGYIYWPGWTKPGDANFYEINKDNHDNLPEHLRLLLRTRLMVKDFVNWQLTARNGEYPIVCSP